MAGIRNTIQKGLIAEAVMNLNHPTAEQVYLAVSSKIPQVSRATIYRNLTCMVDAGELARISPPREADVFDITLEPHSHVLCSRCGRVADITLGALPDLLREAEAATGFALEEGSLCFRGVCADCQTKNDGGKNHE